MIDRVETMPAPPVEVSTGVLGEVQEADRQIARWTAVRARAVAASPCPGRPRPTGSRASPAR
jgi:hypothetical protein